MGRGKEVVMNRVKRFEELLREIFAIGESEEELQLDDLEELQEGIVTKIMNLSGEEATHGI